MREGERPVDERRIPALDLTGDFVGSDDCAAVDGSFVLAFGTIHDRFDELPKKRLLVELVLAIS